MKVTDPSKQSSAALMMSSQRTRSESEPNQRTMRHTQQSRRHSGHTRQSSLPTMPSPTRHRRPLAPEVDCHVARSTSPNPMTSPTTNSSATLHSHSDNSTCTSESHELQRPRARLCLPLISNYTARGRVSNWKQALWLGNSVVNNRKLICAQ